MVDYDTGNSCLTLPGAGESLQWTVTVDGQVSELSSTDYASPVITQLSGAGAIDGSVYGDQLVTITGDYFGPTTDTYDVRYVTWLVHWSDICLIVFFCSFMFFTCTLVVCWSQVPTISNIRTHRCGVRRKRM